MSEVSKIVTHYLEEIVRSAGLKGFDEIRAEIESAAEQDDRRLEQLEEKVETPDWRERR